MLSVPWWFRWNKRFDLGDKFRDIDGGYQPHSILTNFAVIVGKDISLSDNFSPRDLLVFFFKVL